MHDPTIMIFSTRLLTLWHIDPEVSGDDDSCGWAWPKLSESDKTLIKEMVEWEESIPYFTSPNLPATIVNPAYSYRQMLAGDCLAFVAAAWGTIAWRRDRRKKLTADEWWAVAFLATSSVDNLRACLSDPDRPLIKQFEHFMHCVMRVYLDHHRPWYRHPRWHIHHWRFQWHPTQALKRWLWSRCGNCGKRFPWDYSPISTNWGGGGPHWFKGEEKVFHHDCYSPSAQPAVETRVPQATKDR